MRRFNGKNAFWASLVSLGAAWGVPATAQAATVTLTGDGAWFDFYAVDGAASWLDVSGEAVEFTYTSNTAFQLRLVDYFFPGDSAQVYANGTLLGSTPAVPYDDTLFAATPNSAFGNSAWSKRTWTLGAGAYTFSGLPSVLPTGASVLAISVTAVPEPAMAWLAGVGVLGVLSARRRLA